MNATDVSERAVAPSEAPSAETPHEPQPQEIAHEIDVVRTELSELTGELDRRRHEAVDVKVQIHRHPIAVAIVGAAALLALVGVADWLYRRLRPESPGQRAQKLARATRIVLQDPDTLLRALEGHPDPRASVLAALIKLGRTAGQRAINPART